MNGTVVAPGAEFNFLGRVGTISLATGWKMGGVS